MTETLQNAIRTYNFVSLLSSVFDSPDNEQCSQENKYEPHLEIPYIMACTISINSTWSSMQSDQRLRSQPD